MLQTSDLADSRTCLSMLLVQTRSKKGYRDGNDLVLKTLDQIKEVGFSVIRTWAFQDDPDPNQGGALHYKDSGAEPVSSKLQGSRMNSDSCNHEEVSTRHLLSTSKLKPAWHVGMRLLYMTLAWHLHAYAHS